MRRFIAVGAMALVAAVQAADAGAVPGLRATVTKIPPTVQRAGQAYAISIRVRTGARPVKKLCLDFEDGDGSWLIRVPGLRAYDDDVFCFGRLARGVKAKTFVAFIVAAKPGSHKLGVGIGNATVYPTVNNAVLDADSLWWERDFVIV